jgi:hypothetical protein
MMGIPQSETLKGFIDRWIAEKPARNITILASQAGVKYNTVRRIYIGEVEPECYTAMSLLMVIATQRQSVDYMKKYFPNAVGFFGRFAESSKAEFLPNPSLYSKDIQTFVILHLAYARLATKANILKLFGEMALPKAEALVKDGILGWSEDDRSLLPADGKEYFFYEDKDAIADGCHHIAELVRVDKPENAPVSMIVSLTKEEKETVKQILRAALEEIGAIVERSAGGTELIAISTIFARILGDDV